MFAVGTSIFNKEFVEAVVVANPNMAANPAIQAEMIREDKVEINGMLWMIYTRSGQRFVCYTRPETFQKISQTLLEKTAPTVNFVPSVNFVPPPEPVYTQSFDFDPNFTPSAPVVSIPEIIPPRVEPPKIVQKAVPVVKPLRMADANMTNESNRGQVVSFGDEEYSAEDIRKMTKKNK